MRNFFKYLPLRKKLFLSYFLYSLIIALIAIIIYSICLKRQKIDKIDLMAKDMLVTYLKVQNAEQSFFNNKPYTASFYEQGEDIYWNEYQKRIISLRNELDDLIQVSLDQEILLKDEIEGLKKEIEVYEEKMKLLVGRKIKKGNLDFGVEGQWRKAQRSLEERSMLSAKDLLELQHLERNYMLRKEDQYSQLLNQKVEELIRQDATHPSERNQILNQYINNFNLLVSLEKEIGCQRNEGLKGAVVASKEKINTKIDLIYNALEDSIRSIRASFRNTFAIMIIIALSVSLLLSYLFSKLMIKPIEKLSRVTQQLIQSDFKEKVELDHPLQNDEVGQVIKSFNLLFEEIQKRIREINEHAALIENKNIVLEENNHKLFESEKRLSKLIDLKNQLISIISHDLRTPLNSLKAFLEILINYSNGFSPEELKKLANEMRNAVNRVNNLLEDLLQWSRAQSGDSDFKIEILNVKDLLLDNVKMQSLNAENKKIRFHYDIDNNALVLADKNMLDFVIRNILTNAIKFTEKGGEVKIISFEEKDKIRITIQDSGIGIAPENIKKMLDPSTHYSISGTENEKGTGFGLLMSKDFMSKNSGKIEIESELGVGTSIHLILPKA